MDSHKIDMGCSTPLMEKLLEIFQTSSFIFFMMFLKVLFFLLLYTVDYRYKTEYTLKGVCLYGPFLYVKM